MQSFSRKTKNNLSRYAVTRADFCLENVQIEVAGLSLMKLTIENYSWEGDSCSPKQNVLSLAFYGTGWFVFKRTLTELMHLIPHPNFKKHVNVTLRLTLWYPTWLDFPKSIPWAAVLLCIFPECLVKLTFFDFINRKLFCEEWKQWITSLSIFLHPSNTYILLFLNILHSILFSDISMYLYSFVKKKKYYIQTKHQKTQIIIVKFS